MIVHFDGTDYDFDLEAMDLAEAKTIYAKTGMTVGGLIKGLADLHPDALRATHWLMLKQAGRLTDMDKENFAVLKFGKAIGDAFDAEEAEENPTEGTPEEVPVQT